MTATAASPVVKPLDPARDVEAFALIGTEFVIPDLPALFAEARADAHGGVFAVVLGDELVGVYVLRSDGMANTVSHLVIARDHRRQGLGRMALMDSLFRSGKRPLVISTDEAALPFFKKVGFKMVGKRPYPNGMVIYRLGWHAPRPGAAPGQDC